jgi:diguanylate cyclase (GGDEF)-like protein/PAS domain S-box-containing protein
VIVRVRGLALRNIAIALAVGLLLTALSTSLVWVNLKNDIDRRFNIEARGLVENIEHELATGSAIVESLVTFFLSAPYADESSFHVVGERLMERAPFVSALAYFPYVDAEQRDAFEQEMALRGYAGFHVREMINNRLQLVKARPRHLPLIYIEPLAVTNAMLLGLDLEADELLKTTLREVVERNATRGRFNPRGLSRIGDYWLFAPLFADASKGGSGSLSGIVAVAVDLHALVRRQEFSPGMRFSIYESGNSQSAIVNRGARVDDSGMRFWRQFQIGNPVHPLMIEVEQGFGLAQLPAANLLLSLGGGLVLTLVLIYFAHTSTLRTRWLVARNQEIDQQIETRNLELSNAETQLEDSLLQLREQAEKYRNLFENTSEGCWLINTDCKTVNANEAFCRMLGYQRQEVEGHSLFDFLIDDNRRIFKQRIEQIADTHHQRFELKLNGQNGEQIPVIIAASGLYDSDGEVTGIFAFVTDISQRKQMERELNLAASVFTFASEGILITDADSNIIDVNDAFSRITGFSRDEVIGQNSRMLRSGHQSDAFYQSMWQQLLENGVWEGEVWNRRKNGEVYVELLLISAVTDEYNRVHHYVGLFSDITAQKNQLTQMTYKAHYDVLTQLPNRLLLFDRLSQAMSREPREGMKIVVVYIDLDGFKAVNDDYGHAAGDVLLTTISRRMQKLLRDGDTLARLGGDEFVALLIDLADEAQATPVLERLLDAAAEPVEFDGRTITVSASIGYTVYPQQRTVDTDELLKQADLAMYQAKKLGKNRYQHFDPE